MKKIISIFLLVFCILAHASAQELNCRVSLNYSSLSTTPTPVFQALQKDVTAFMNERRWTNHQYESYERIDFTLLITITEFNGVDKFTGTIQVNLSRPVFNSSYNSPLFTFKESDGNFVFHYLEGQPLDYVENMFTSNLTQVLAFYAYVVLGYDYDTFSPLGGTDFFRKAFRIVLNSQSSGYEGWSSADSKQNTRYNLIDALLDKRFENLRQGQYLYHRQGLDLMPSDPDAARKNMVEALKSILRSERSKQNSLVVSLFFTAKSDELVNVFSVSPETEKNEVIVLLKELDVSNLTKYQKIKQ